MLTPVPYRNQPSNLQHKSVEWFQHKNIIDMKKDNSTEINLLLKLEQQL